MPVSASSSPLVPENLIAGAWLPGSGEAVQSLNPAKPDDIVASFKGATESDIKHALEAATGAQRAWNDMGIIKRGQILRAVADLIDQRREAIAALMTREQGKTLAEARGEVDGSSETIRYHAASSRNPLAKTYPSSFPGEHIEVVREALGVVAVITPWNFPTQIPAWKIAPALLWGNTVVWKPASDIPAVSQAFIQAFHDAGVPAGVVNMVLASGRVAQHLVDSPQVSGISFTGSVPVGEMIAQSATSRRVKVQLELGGHNAAIVMPDVDPFFAASQLTIGAMSGTGQKCTATRRIITVGDIHDSFVAALVTEVEKLTVGDGANPSTTIGPVISASAQAQIESAVADAVSEGGVVIARAQVPKGPGFFVGPTVIEGTMEVRTCREEVFGPITTVMRARDLEEAIELANSTEFGLTASIFSTNDADILRATAGLTAGLIKINAPNTGSELHVPFGGLKASTFPAPREQNAESVADFFTNTKSVYRRVAPRRA
ncbi:MAG: aldehyde dehydrogenase [Microbacteriaceae bacterium BACL25 MAG-120322-bin65]|nr:MAG: aldehyde dehydrogenase [Microbacteriaceae bacterium BACL25 MAG-120322-bin65]HAA79802.1 aldehyde dehydrogenase [Microbacteriaceae bacterium]